LETSEATKKLFVC